VALEQHAERFGIAVNMLAQQIFVRRCAVLTAGARLPPLVGRLARLRQGVAA
jgi:hypothetical protein